MLEVKKVAVLGLGYVGLPLAALCAIKGYQVVGIDNNASVVAGLSEGSSHIVDPCVERLLDEAITTSRFTATSDLHSLQGCNLFIICVPTPVDSNFEPDLTPLLAAVADITPYLASGSVVVVESTVFPGTCEELVLPLLEAGSGLRVGVDIHLAHCPERVNPGDDFWNTQNIPRVVGATTPQGAQLAAEFYSSLLGGGIIDVRDIKNSMRPKFVAAGVGYASAKPELGSVTMMRSIRDAEAVKAMENTVRDVNIAFVNELAKISDVLDLDVVDVIDGMSTKPFGKGPFFPGVGVGGHCIAVDPEWLKSASVKAGYMPELIQLARNTNNTMPAYTVDLLQDALNDCGYPVKGTAVAVLGVAYKKNVDDIRESPFFAVRKLLLAKGAELKIYDSWAKSENNVDSLQAALTGVKAVFIVTDHDDCVAQLKAVDFSQLGIEVVVDGRNCLNSADVVRQSVIYRGVGRK